MNLRDNEYAAVRHRGVEISTRTFDIANLVTSGSQLPKMPNVGN